VGYGRGDSAARLAWARARAGHLYFFLINENRKKKKAPLNLFLFLAASPPSRIISFSVLLYHRSFQSLSPTLNREINIKNLHILSSLYVICWKNVGLVIKVRGKQKVYK
jgi:hypothetical protein